MALLPVLQSAERNTDASGDIRLGNLDFVHREALTVAVKVGASIVEPGPDEAMFPQLITANEFLWGS